MSEDDDWALDRACYLNYPHNFGENVREDLDWIKDAWGFAGTGVKPDVRRAFESVTDSVNALFQGDRIVFRLSEDRKRAIGRIYLGFLDSAFLAALDRNQDGVDCDTFDAAKKRFLEECPGAAELLGRSKDCDSALSLSEDEAESRRLVSQSLCHDVRFILLAHENHARRDGRRSEEIFARELGKVIAITEGQEAREMTPEDVYQILKTAADECEDLNVSMAIAGDGNDFSLLQMGPSV